MGGPIFNSHFCWCFIVDLLMEHKLLCVKSNQYNPENMKNKPKKHPQTLQDILTYLGVLQSDCYSPVSYSDDRISAICVTENCVTLWLCWYRPRQLASLIVPTNSGLCFLWIFNFLFIVGSVRNGTIALAFWGSCIFRIAQPSPHQYLDV